MENGSVEWLETDGLGGFASGTVSGIRTRRYHALLLPATTPPSGRMVLVNGLDAWVETASGRIPISSQRYAPDVIHPDGADRLVRFTADPWPQWRFRLSDGLEIEQECFARHGTPLIALSWRLTAPADGATLHVRLFMSGRDFHSLHHENGAFQFEPIRPGDAADRLLWRPYPGLPGIVVATNGTYSHQPEWYRQFRYIEESARGLYDQEDLASPGVFRWNLSHGEATLLLAAEASDQSALPAAAAPAKYLTKLRTAEKKRRDAFPTSLHRAADAYLVKRGKGHTIIAGYPWFGDWGRDTFIALRGLCLATGRLAEARSILLEWADSVSEGMLPNRFPDHGDQPEFNSVDASLWFIVAAHDYMHTMAGEKRTLATRDRARLRAAIEAILTGYSRGTRYGIRMDHDALLAAGVPGVQLTWMDAKVGDWVVTPRIGKPVEIQALWLNALRIAGEFAPPWKTVFAEASNAFQARFYRGEGMGLYDVVDCNHEAGTTDPSLRPNQIFAVGGLPFPLLDGAAARCVVDVVEQHLWTPLGLRSLAPGEPGYRPYYEGDVWQRDGAYHQGTVWPWLIGPFVEAWVRVRGGTAQAKREARARFLAPILAHMDETGISHIPEIADAEPPHRPKGCPFQAWSLAEVLRLDAVVLGTPTTRRTKSSR